MHAMRRSCFRRRTIRLRLTILALVALLFQQAIFAVYACQLPHQPLPVASAMAGMAGCAGMAQNQAGQHPPDPHGLCAQHCAQQPPAQSDARLPALAALVLPPPPPMVDVRPVAPVRSAPADPRRALREPPPRPSCALLI